MAETLDSLRFAERAKKITNKAEVNRDGVSPQVLQLMQANAIGICQIDSCRVGGVNEILAILLLAAKFNKEPESPSKTLASFKGLTLL